MWTMRNFAKFYDILFQQILPPPAKKQLFSKNFAHSTTHFRANVLFRGLKRDVVYLGWPIRPRIRSPNAGGRGGVVGSQPVSRYTAVHRSSKKLWRSNSIFNLRFYYTNLTVRSVLGLNSDIAGLRRTGSGRYAASAASPANSPTSTRSGAKRARTASASC